MPLMQAIAEDIDAIALTDEAAIASERDRIRGLLFAGHNRISAELMDSLPNLEIMVAPSAGFEGVDLDAARARGITVTSGGDVGSRDVAHFAIALTLALRHHIVPSHDFVTSGAWLKGWPAARRSFRVDRVGVVGLGPIGQAVANGIAPLCGEVGWWGPRPKQLPWKRHENLMALAEWSDVLILCARSGADTAGMIDAAVLDAIGPKGSFVNIARGFMVDEDALIDALRAGRLGSAGLDVMVEEPARPDRWADVPNVLLAPHMAGVTTENQIGVVQLAISNLRTLLSGETPRFMIVDGHRRLSGRAPPPVA